MVFIMISLTLTVRRAKVRGSNTQLLWGKLLDWMLLLKIFIPTRYWPACGSIHCAMTSRSFSSATFESSPPFSGSWMKKLSLGLGLQKQQTQHVFYQIQEQIVRHTTLEKKRCDTRVVSVSWESGCWQSLEASGWCWDPVSSCWPTALRGPVGYLLLLPMDRKVEDQWHVRKKEKHLTLHRPYPSSSGQKAEHCPRPLCSWAKGEPRRPQ